MEVGPIQSQKTTTNLRLLLRQSQTSSTVIKMKVGICSLCICAATSHNTIKDIEL